MLMALFIIAGAVTPEFFATLVGQVGGYEVTMNYGQVIFTIIYIWQTLSVIQSIYIIVRHPQITPPEQRHGCAPLNLSELA
jgi:hypothetical protein